MPPNFSLFFFKEIVPKLFVGQAGLWKAHYKSFDLLSVSLDTGVVVLNIIERPS